MKHSFQKTIVALLLITVFSGIPQIISAQTTQQQTPPPRAIEINETTMQPVQVNTNNQAGSALYGQQTTNGGSGNAAGGVTGCALSGVLANLVKNQVSNLVSNMVSSAVGGEVPTAENQARAKDTGLLGAITWDQIAWCAVNEIIAEIGRATIAWINSGFEGNPVFVDNPEQFFADIADIQAGNILNEISNGFLCSPIKNIVRVNLANRYNSSVAPYGPQCSFTAISGNIDQFMSGETFSWQDWYSYTQVPSNNPYGATIYGNIELDSRIAQSIGIQSKLLDWGRGFLSFTDPTTGKVSSPGAVVEGQLNQRLFSGESRLQIADEFDEIVTALVNQLVKVAISEVTGSGN